MRNKGSGGAPTPAGIKINLLAGGNGHKHNSGLQKDARGDFGLQFGVCSAHLGSVRGEGSSERARGASRAPPAFPAGDRDHPAGTPQVAG